MDGKENFKKMLQDMVGESMAMDMEEAGKQLARATRGYYTALIDEGFRVKSGRDHAGICQSGGQEHPLPYEHEFYDAGRRSGGV